MTDTSSATPPSFSIRAAGDRNIMTAVVAALPAPSAAFFDEARAADLTKEEHDRLAGQLPALSAIEVVRSRAADDAPAGNNTTVAAWNAERLKYHAPSVELVRRSGADVLLLSEADLGMARAGNRHTVADLAREIVIGMDRQGGDEEQAEIARYQHREPSHGEGIGQLPRRAGDDEQADREEGGDDVEGEAAQR